MKPKRMGSKLTLCMCKSNLGKLSSHEPGLDLTTLNEIWTAQPGTLNNHCLTDVWWNNHFLCSDLESSNWNNHKKLVVWGSRRIYEIEKANHDQNPHKKNDHVSVTPKNYPV